MGSQIKIEDRRALEVHGRGRKSGLECLLKGSGPKPFTGDCNSGGFCSLDWEATSRNVAAEVYPGQEGHRSVMTDEGKMFS